MIFGISGKIASGKSTMAKNILEHGYISHNALSFAFPHAEICEVDSIGHFLLKDRRIQKLIHDAFLGDISDDQNADFHSQLRESVYRNPDTLSLLESILHPPMMLSLKESLDNAKKRKKNLIVVCALPITFSLDRFCEKILVVPVKKETAWKRAQVRNPNMPFAFFETIWNRQEREYKKFAKAEK